MLALDLDSRLCHVIVMRKVSEIHVRMLVMSEETRALQVRCVTGP